MNFRFNLSFDLFTVLARSQSQRNVKLFYRHNSHTVALNYVQRMKKLQQFKEKSDQLDETLLKKAKYLVYHKGRPLLTDNFAIPWTDFARLDIDLGLIKESCVLLGVTANHQLQIAVQIGNVEEGVREGIEDRLGGSFRDFRVSLMMMSAADAAHASKSNATFNWHRKTKFCSSCGSQSLSRHSSGSSITCTGCSTVFYPSLAPVGITTIAERSNSKLLLVRQSRHPKGMYSCVAGFVDTGETIEESIKREVAEEVGLTVNSVEYQVSQHWAFPTSNLMIGCHAIVDGNEELDIDRVELEDARWFPVEDIRRSLSAVKENPMKAIQKQQFFVPPKGTVAHYLIDSWIKRLN